MKTMKTVRVLTFCLLPALAAVSTMPSSAAITYNDLTNDVFTGAGGGILDISSVEVNNNATDLIFKINLTGNPTTADWGKYMIGINSVPAGDPAGNGWGRPISMTAGMDYWMGSWVDGGNGVQVSKYSGSWAQTGAAGPFAGGPPLAGLAITKDASSVTLTVPFAALGLSLGNSFDFDVYTSGGGAGDSAVDALANPGQTISDWGIPYNSASPNIRSYTLVPESTALALIGIGGALCLVRRR